MTKVILQPAANEASERNYDATIRNPVALGEISADLHEYDRHILEVLTKPSQGKVALWGAKPGEDGRNNARWGRIASGDYVLFFMGKDQVMVATVIHKFRNPELASRLWGKMRTANGVEQTWELMFALTDPAEIHLSKLALNDAIGRKPNANVQEFVVLQEDQSESLISLLSLTNSEVPNISDELVQLSTRPSVSEALSTIDSLDDKIISLRRKEQAILRKFLLISSTGTCALCQRDFPAEFLVAAHIKRRSVCSDTEKRDFENIAMINCRMGCDELFGRGLIGVSPTAQIMVSQEAPEFGAVGAYLEEVLPVGPLRFIHDHPKSANYFNFHMENDFRGTRRYRRSELIAGGRPHPLDTQSSDRGFEDRTELA